MRLLLPAFSARRGRLSNTTRSKPQPPRSRPDDNSLTAERVRSAVLSHRDWMAAEIGGGGLRERWRPIVC